jgi:N-acetylglucosaminyl-diphospho-decaprenol L-rhamnosyltransferase
VSPPAVSVSIVNAGNRDLLLACLESLSGEDAEVVVLDNASEDGSVDAVRARFPDVRVIAQAFRAGFGANHNAVIGSTSGRYVFVLNDDTTSEDWGLARMTAYLDAHPAIAALGPRLVFPDGGAQPSAWRFPSPGWSAAGALTLGRVGIAQSRGRSVRPVDWVTGAAMLLRRSVLDEVGLFDEGFFMYSEETDLCRRMRDAGHEIVWFPDVTVVHHVARTTAELPERRVNEMWRSRHRYWHKHHSATGARLAALATGAQYRARAELGRLTRRDASFVARMRLHARDSRRVDGPGLRELAEEWNGRVGAPAR